MIFAPVVDQILDLVQQQISDARNDFGKNVINV
jgi:hypothetical protein